MWSYLSTQQRRYIAMCRGGVLPIEIEKGRWRNKPREQRICKQCVSGEVEDISHFILHCTCHRNLRETYLPPNESLEDILMGRTYLKNLSIYITKAFLTRKWCVFFVSAHNYFIYYNSRIIMLCDGCLIGQCWPGIFINVWHINKYIYIHTYRCNNWPTYICLHEDSLSIIILIC